MSTTTPAAGDLDPITFAVLKNALDAIVDEVAYTVIRTARSEIVKDVMDYSAAICDRKGRMIAQAKTIALHLGAVPEAMDAAQEPYGEEALVACVAGSRSDSLASSVEKLLAAVEAWCQPKGPLDDVSILGLEWRP